MNTDIKSISNLEKPVGTLKILVHLHKKEKVTITALIRDIKLNQRTTYSALMKLQEYGLIYQEETHNFPMCKYYMLTNKGDKIAQYLTYVAYLLAHEYEQ